MTHIMYYLSFLISSLLRYKRLLVTLEFVVESQRGKLTLSLYSPIARM